MSLGFLQLLFLALWFTAWFLLWRRKRMPTIIMSVSSVLCAVMLMVKTADMTHRTGVIMKNSATVYAGPDKNYHVVGTLDNMVEVTVTHERAAWCKVQHKKLVGWVLADTITVV